MKNFYHVIFSVLLTCSTLVLHAKEINETQNQQTIAFERFTNTEKGYSIDYPSDWKKNDVPQLDFVLFAPPKKAGEKIHASMNIVSEKVGSDINLDQFYTESINNLSTSLKEVNVEKSGISTFNGVTSKWVLYTHLMQGVKFHVLQYFIVAHDTMFLITFSTAADEFDDYRAEFEKIANTFKLT
jgi:hypothetical protein